jgi:hypothetical protein
LPAIRTSFAQIRFNLKRVHRDAGFRAASA